MSRCQAEARETLEAREAPGQVTVSELIQLINLGQG